MWCVYTYTITKEKGCSQLDTHNQPTRWVLCQLSKCSWCWPHWKSPEQSVKHIAPIRTIPATDFSEFEISRHRLCICDVLLKSGSPKIIPSDIFHKGPNMIQIRTPRKFSSKSVIYWLVVTGTWLLYFLFSHSVGNFLSPIDFHIFPKSGRHAPCRWHRLGCGRIMETLEPRPGRSGLRTVVYVRTYINT